VGEAGVGKTRPASRIARRKWADFPPGTGTTGARKVKNSEAIENAVLWTLDMKENPWARLLAYVTAFGQNIHAARL